MLFYWPFSKLHTQLFRESADIKGNEFLNYREVWDVWLDELGEELSHSKSEHR